MQGLPQLHHHEVGHIHDIVDRAEPHRFQLPPHPEGRRSDPDMFDDPGRVAWTEIGIFDGNRCDPADLLLIFHHDGKRITQRLSSDGRHFACHADDRETIGPVRGYADIENRVPQVECVRQPFSQRQIGWKKHNPRCVAADSELFFGAEHPLGNLFTDTGALDTIPGGKDRSDRRQRNDITNVNVFCTTNNGIGFVPRCHLTEGQLIGTGMGFDRDNPGDPDPAEGGFDSFQGVHFQTGHGQPVPQLFR